MGKSFILIYNGLKSNQSKAAWTNTHAAFRNCANMPYNLKSDYISREVPQYFDDVLPDSSAWQCDVYRLAAKLARESGIQRLVDIGCGRAEKLLSFADEFQLTGIDYGANISHLIQNHPQHHWIDIDLNANIILAETFVDSICICADIIEHLPNPD